MRGSDERLLGGSPAAAFVGVVLFVVVPVVLTVLAWDELLPHVVERWSGSSALARVWVSAGTGALLLLYVYWVGEKILERQLIGAAFLALTLPFMAVGGGLLAVFFTLLWGAANRHGSGTALRGFLCGCCGMLFLRAAAAMA